MDIGKVNQSIPLKLGGQQPSNAQINMVKDPLQFQKMLQGIIKSNPSPQEASKVISQLPIDFARFLTPKEIEQLASKLVSQDIVGVTGKKKNSLFNMGDETQNIPYLGAMKTAQDGKKEVLVGQLFPEQKPEDPALSQRSEETLNPKNIYEEGFSDRSVNLTPFQFFLDKSLEYFGRLSLLESQTDQLMVDYIEGRRSIEELTIEKAKVSVGLSFAVTVASQVQQSFSQVLQMNI